MPQALEHSISFLRRWIAAPEATGAIAPSSRRLGHALAAPFAEAHRPAAVLEVGAGTGAVTRVLGELLKPQDTLDVCELQSELVDVLARDVLPAAPLAEAYRERRVRLLHGAIEEIPNLGAYDFVVCGLPFTGFPPDKVKGILSVIESVLKPGGVFSYFEYIALRRVRTAFTLGAKRQVARKTSATLDDLIARHQIGFRHVWTNLPPATARYCRFKPGAAS
jgi:phospholipid N-methyltransferase